MSDGYDSGTSPIKAVEVPADSSPPSRAGASTSPDAAMATPSSAPNSAESVSASPGEIDSEIPDVKDSVPRPPGWVGTFVPICH